MKKIYLFGDSLVNDELKVWLKDKVEFSQNLDNTVNVVFDTTSFPREHKLKNVEFID